MPLTRLTTAGIAPEHQLDAWQELLTSRLYPLRVRPVGAPDRFHADFLATGGRLTGITRGAMDPMRSSITRQAANQNTAGSLQLVLHSGRSRFVEARGTTTEFAADALLVQGSDEACTHVHLHPHEVVLLNVPRAGLSLQRSTLKALMFRPLALAPTAVGVLRSAARHLLDPAQELPPEAVDHYLIGVAELVLRGVAGVPVDHAGTAESRRRQAIDHITARLADPTLTAQAVADALHMSRRRLYQLFDGEPGVLSRIRDMRVARARELLTDPATASWSTERIARACGFTSRSHFSRVFSRLTGVSPSEFRATR